MFEIIHEKSHGVKVWDCAEAAGEGVRVSADTLKVQTDFNSISINKPRYCIRQLCIYNF